MIGAAGFFGLNLSARSVEKDMKPRISRENFRRIAE